MIGPSFRDLTLPEQNRSQLRQRKESEEWVNILIARSQRRPQIVFMGVETKQIADELEASVDQFFPSRHGGLPFDPSLRPRKAEGNWGTISLCRFERLRLDACHHVFEPGKGGRLSANLIPIPSERGGSLAASQGRNHVTFGKVERRRGIGF